MVRVFKISNGVSKPVFLKSVVIIILSLCTTLRSNAQNDTIKVYTTGIKPEKVKTIIGAKVLDIRNIIIVLNDLIIRDTADALRLLRHLNEKDVSMRYFSPEESIKMFNLQASSGILYLKTRRKIYIDISNMEIIKQ